MSTILQDIDEEIQSYVMHTGCQPEYIYLGVIEATKFREKALEECNNKYAAAKRVTDVAIRYNSLKVLFVPVLNHLRCS